MMFDQAIIDAKMAYDLYRSITHRGGTKEQAEALAPTLKALSRVLVAVGLSGGLIQRGSPLALELFKAHRASGPVTQLIKISVLQNGDLMKEDVIACCPEEHNVLAQRSHKVELVQLLNDGLPVHDLMKNIAEFLADPDGTFLAIQNSVSN